MYELLHRVRFIRVLTFAIIAVLIQPSLNLNGSEGDQTVTSDVKVENDHKGNIPAENHARPSRISTTYQQFVKAREKGTEPILPDFSYAGYHYFSEPVPDASHPIFDVTEYGAIPNDALSDQKAIQAAIDAAEANGRGIVFFPPGEFLVNTDADNNEPIYIHSSHIVLRGSGSREGGTVIRQVTHLPPKNPNQLYSTPYMFIFSNYLGCCV